MNTESIATKKTLFPSVRYFAGSTAGIALYCISQGIGGIVILLFSLSLIYPPSVLPLGLPLVVGFNSAAAGFAFMERIKGSLASRKLQLTTIGLVMSFSGSSLLVFFCPWETVCDPVNHIQPAVVSLPLIFLGGWIGVQSRQQGLSASKRRKEDTN